MDINKIRALSPTFENAHTIFDSYSSTDLSDAWSQGSISAMVDLIVNSGDPTLIAILATTSIKFDVDYVLNRLRELEDKRAIDMFCASVTSKRRSGIYSNEPTPLVYRTMEESIQ